MAADILNDKVVPFFDEHKIPLLRILTYHGTEYCGNREHHEFELYLALEDINHSRTRARSPQSNGICERFLRTILNEFYQVAFRKKLYRSRKELQADVEQWIDYYKKESPHSGKYCFGKTPKQTFLDSIQLAKDKIIDSKFLVTNNTDCQTSS